MKADEAADPGTRAEFRFGAVFLLIIALLVFAILAPSGNAAGAVILALEAAALLVVVATSRERRAVRTARARALGIVAVILVGVVVAGTLPLAVISLLNGSLATGILLALVGGLLRLVRLRGVTPQVVAGALTIYVLIGLIFAYLVSFVAEVDGAAFFAEGASSQGDRVYYSFAVLTTTGFGDFTAATPLGHALAVMEMLIGQLYLVTVIGVLVGNFAGRARS